MNRMRIARGDTGTFVQRNFQLQNRSLPRTRADIQGTAQYPNPFTNTCQTDARTDSVRPRDRAFVETLAVVLNLQAHAVQVSFYSDRRSRRMRVLDQIVQGLLQDAIN